jgi:Kef-type K+ transport system membrane component KefB
VSTAGFGISIYYFIEMKVLSLRVASMVSGAVILSGLLAILLMIASQATNYAVSYGAFKTTIAVSWFLAKLIMFFAIAYFLTSRFLKLVTKSGFEKRPRQMLIGYLLLVASLYAWAAMHFGSFAAVGVASMGGVLLGVSQPGLKEKIKEGLRSVAGSFPIGIFLVVLGMEVNLKGNEGHIALLVVLLTTVIFTKLVGCRMAFRRISEDLPERFLIMTGMLPQGEMGVIITAYSYSRGLVTPVSFNVAIIVIVVLTMITPILIEVVSRLSLGVAPHCGEKKQSPEIASFRSQ